MAENVNDPPSGEHVGWLALCVNKRVNRWIWKSNHWVIYVRFATITLILHKVCFCMKPERVSRTWHSWLSEVWNIPHRIKPCTTGNSFSSLTEDLAPSCHWSSANRRGKRWFTCSFTAIFLRQFFFYSALTRLIFQWQKFTTWNGLKEGEAASNSGVPCWLED